MESSIQARSPLSASQVWPAGSRLLMHGLNKNSVSKVILIYDFNGSCLILQRIRSTVDEREQKHLLKELDIVMNSGDCPYIVMFYGALFKEVESYF